MLRDYRQAIAVLKETRMKQDLLQKELSALSGVNQQTICKVENYKQIPTLDTFFRLVTALGFEVALVPQDDAEEGDLNE